LPIKTFVLNNQGYASIRTMQRNHFGGHLVGCDATSGLTLPSITKVARAYGISTRSVRGQARLREVVRDVLNTPGPVLCEVVVAPDQPVGPRVSSVVRADGSIVSRPLEDLYPFLSREQLRANMLIPMLDE
jgi:acetolactate synthase-1/2/3 large subunit